MDKKNKKNFIKELNSTPRGKAILFFVGYAFFFIFLIVFVRFSASGNSGKKLEYDRVREYNFSIRNITNENYQFKHTVLVDNENIIYEGIRYKDNDLFKVVKSTGSYDYYRRGVDYFVNNNGLWINTDKPYIYIDFFDIDRIMQLISNATLMYKTDYESGKRIYSFNISTTTIHNLFEGIDLDLADDPNEIIVTVDENGYAEKFEFKLNSYCKGLEICNEKMNIVLTYDNYGEVEEITSPLS